MQIGVTGLNHKLANVELRSLFANACEKLFANDSSFPCVLLSTCNRTEIYFSAPMPQMTHSQILYILREHLPFEFEHLLYSYFNEDCFAHLCKVSSGLDSAIAAETAIQGQVRQAYRLASQKHTLSHTLHYLFQKASQVSKGVRQTFSSLNSFPNLEQAIFQIGHAHFHNLADRHLLFVGASQVNRGIVSFLANKGLASMTLCNRSEKKWPHCDSLPWEALELWPRYDWIIVATKAPHLLIKSKPHLSNTQTLLFDLSMPANVDRRLAAHPGITLLDVDKVNETLAYSRKQYRQVLAQAEEHIEQATRGKLHAYRQKQLQVV